jgi:hypothetical protein
MSTKDKSSMKLSKVATASAGDLGDPVCDLHFTLQCNKARSVDKSNVVPQETERNETPSNQTQTKTNIITEQSSPERPHHIYLFGDAPVALLIIHVTIHVPFAQAHLAPALHAIVAL